MSDETTLGMSVPLDSDGFLRRECPTCEREFKWVPDADDAAESEPPEGGYFCPYCAIQAPADAWFTQAQLELAENIVTTELVDPMLKDFTRGINTGGRRSGGMFSVTASYDTPEKMDHLTEADDMRRVDFACHPMEPVKVLDQWDRQVHCLICEEPTT